MKGWLIIVRCLLMITGMGVDHWVLVYTPRESINTCNLDVPVYVM